MSEGNELGVPTIWFSNFPNGRFANSIFQFLFAEYLKQQIPATVILGGERSPCELPWLMFNLPDHRRQIAQASLSGISPLIYRLAENETPHETAARIKERLSISKNLTLAIDGFFQFDTRSIALDDAMALIFSNYVSVEKENTTFQKLLRQQRILIDSYLGDAYLIGVHARRGDYVNHPDQNVFFTLDLSKVIEFIKNYVFKNKITKAAIYVASEDGEYCRSVFHQNQLNIITSKDILGELHYPVDLLTDIAALSCASCFVASNSSLSIISALINNRAKVFVRQTSRLGDLVPFDPWATTVLHS